MAKRDALHCHLMRSAKRAKVDPLVSGVMEALEFGTGLSPECKTMLLAACPLSLGLPANKRHAAHDDIVDMIGEVLANSAKALKTSVGTVESKITELEAKQCELCRKLQDAKADLKDLAEALKSEQQDAEAVDLAAMAADEVLRQRLESQAAGDKQVSRLKAEKARFESAVEQHLKPMQLEELEEFVAEKHARVLQTCVEALIVDEALLVALPKVCARPLSSRCTFDNIVLDALAEALRAQVVSVNKRLEAEAPQVTERAEALTEALHAIEVNVAAQKRHADALQAACTAEKEHRAAVEAVQMAVLQLEVEIEKARRELGFASSGLAEFKAWPLECFNMLKDKASGLEAAGA